MSAVVKQYDEGSATSTNAKLRDKNDDLAAPTTMRYRIDCETTGQAVLGWTDITPGMNVDIPVTPEQNTIIRSGNSVERKVMTVEGNSGTPLQVRTVVKWDITRNVSKYTNGASGNDYGMAPDFGNE